MKTEAKFQTIQQYVAHKQWCKEQRRQMIFTVLRLMGIGLFVLLPVTAHFIAWLMSPSPENTKTIHDPTPHGGWVVVSDGTVMAMPIMPSDRGSGISFNDADQALSKAVDLWRVALADNSIAKPVMTAGYCEDSSAVACADVDNQRLYFSANVTRADGSKVDLPTVFMHEVAHLLGVPHIENDPLMNAVYKGKLSEPSPDAVLIAKARRAKPRHRMIEWPTVIPPGERVTDPFNGAQLIPRPVIRTEATR